MADRLQWAPLSLVRQRRVSVDELSADGSDQHGVHDESLEEHRWIEAIPFGGHYLLVCACGCPGPFVLSEEDGALVRCGVFLAWHEGTARLSLCADRAPIDLRKRQRAVSHE